MHERTKSKYVIKAELIYSDQYFGGYI